MIYPPPDKSRREVLRMLASASLLPLVPALGCGDPDDEKPTSDAGATGKTAADGGGSANLWAIGGTAAMTRKLSYPDPFSGALGACAIVASTTEGPCTTPTDLFREDISEGWRGLPMRLGLKIVDAACEPLANATVKIWHTNIEGSYSGETPSSLCLKEADYRAQNFCRGAQTTNANGEAWFDTCFPGWYPGRAIHIHFQVLDRTTSYRVSQLFFPEDVTEDIFASHTEYVPYGQPDTVFASDGVFAAIPTAQRAPLVMEVARMSDGVLLASKVVTVVA